MVPGKGQNVNFAISISHVKQLAAMAHSVQPLASLPAPRAGLVALMKGDGKKASTCGTGLAS